MEKVHCKTFLLNPTAIMRIDVLDNRLFISLNKNLFEVAYPGLSSVNLFKLLKNGISVANIYSNYSQLNHTNEDQLRGSITLFLKKLLKEKVIIDANNVADLISNLPARYIPLSKYFLGSEPISSTAKLNSFKNINKSKVLLIGLGSLGTNIALHLTQAGVGYLKLVDGDNVRVQNLSLQVVYSAEDIGIRKTKALSHHLKRLNKDVRVSVLSEYISSVNHAKKIFNRSEFDLCILTADQPSYEIVRWITRACIDSNIALIRGNSQLIGPLFSPKDIGECPCCYNILNQTTDYRLLSKMYDDFPSIGLSSWPSISGALIAEICLRYLSKSQSRSSINLTSNKYELRSTGEMKMLKKLKRNPDCQICKKN